MEIYDEELAHATIKTEKLHNLPFASWRSKKASGVVQSESNDLQGKEWCKS